MQELVEDVFRLGIGLTVAGIIVFILTCLSERAMGDKNARHVRFETKIMFYLCGYLTIAGILIMGIAYLFSAL